MIEDLIIQKLCIKELYKEINKLQKSNKIELKIKK